MLSTLQEKLRRGMLSEQEPSSSELRRVMAEIREGQGPTQGPVASTACGLEDVMDVDSPDERLAAGATRVPVLLVPRLLAAAAATETAYTDMPMPVTELLLMAQQRDAFATEQREKSVSGGSMEAESSPWTIGQDGLLRFSGCAYVPKDPAIRAEIMRVNHDEPQGGHFGEKRTVEAKTCEVCQRAKVHRHRPYGEMEQVSDLSKQSRWTLSQDCRRRSGEERSMTPSWSW
jgi:hypothetical protein